VVCLALVVVVFGHLAVSTFRGVTQPSVRVAFSDRGPSDTVCMDRALDFGTLLILTGIGH